MNRKFILLTALVCAAVAAPVFAASYVVPPDDVFVGKSDTIVVARAVTSHVIETPATGIETVTQFAVSETIKGFPISTFELHMPGGVLNGRVKMVTGTPSFNVDSEYLLFLRDLPAGGVALTDFGLGAFAFGDHFGRRTLLRGAEAFGWDLDGNTHLEFQRDADAFIEFIKAVVRGETPTADYMLTAPASATSTSFFRAVPMASGGFTGTSYTSTCGGGGQGCTWAGFPVNWNQGSSESGAPGTPPGKSAITTSFASWNNAGVGINYVYSTNTANSNGIAEASDHVNNIVFDKNLSQYGAAFNCASGGLLGVGGVQTASGSRTHNGDSYLNTTEADVSMNVGLADCTSLFNSGDFTTAVAHELGHTLGLRHSDQTRANNPSTACSTDASLDCSNGAVMRSSIPHNVSGGLQTWDRCAVNGVYGAGATSPTITVQPTDTTITSGNQTTLGVSATSPVPISYQWYTGTAPSTASPVPLATGTSLNVAPTSTTSYWVRLTGCGTTDSATATVTVSNGPCTAASISGQPTPSTINQGSAATLSVTAAGTAPFTYAWYAGNPPSTTTPAGTTQSILVSPTTTTSYWARVTNSCGTADSNAATITVNPVQCNAPQVTTQPQSTSISFGAGAQLSVVASGSATLSYQWYVGVKGNTFNPVQNGTNATLAVTPTSTTQYWVRVTNSCGSADSNNATVTVNCASPVINAQPPNRTINSGSSAFLSVVASGGPNLTYQWYTGIQGDTSNPIPSGTTSSITVSPTANTSYWVRVSVTGGCAPTDSQTATVIVNPNTGCPSVTITAPTIVQNGASFTLATTASTGTGGGTVSITWYQQTPSGQTAIGTGSSIVVSPTATTLYLATATNGCGSSSSAPVTVTIGGCAAPSVTQPADQAIGLGSATTLTVSASGGTLHYQWFQGAAGDTSHSVGTDSATLSPGPLFETTSFWVKVTNDCSTSSTSSSTITVTVAPARRRPARH